MRMLMFLLAGGALALASVAPASAGDEAAGASPSVFVPAFAGRVAALGPEAEALSTANTDKVVSILQSGQAFCVSLPDSVYAVDCLAERMEAAAAAMPETGDYADARAVLLAGAARLNALARENADPAKPRANARVAAEGGVRTTRPLVPVRPEVLAEVAAQAQVIVDETETLLLRSAENSAARKVHYERIAAAVESNKVLLRSL